MVPSTFWVSALFIAQSELPARASHRGCHASHVRAQRGRRCCLLACCCACAPAPRPRPRTLPPSSAPARGGGGADLRDARVCSGACVGGVRNVSSCTWERCAAACTHWRLCAAQPYSHAVCWRPSLGACTVSNFVMSASCRSCSALCVVGGRR